MSNNDLISRSDIKDHIGELLLVYSGAELANAILNAIDNAPTVEERPQGEWIKWNFKTFGAMGDWEYKCSNCGKVYDGEYNFCPNCGTDMREEGKA